MGYYIEVPQPFNKADQMYDIYEAQTVVGPYIEIPEGKTLLCVVSNAFFDAIGIMFDEQEMRAFADPTDPRPKTWMLIDTDLARDLCPDYDQWYRANE